MVLHLVPQPLGEGNRRVQNSARQNKKKLLSAVSPHAVNLTRLVLEESRDFLEDRVARLVAVVIVDGLELVDVAHHDRHRLMQTNGVVPLLLQTFLERPPILDSSQSVGE